MAINKSIRCWAACPFVIVVVSLLNHPFCAEAKDLYVSVDGSDGNTGSTAASPLKSIAVASERAYAGDTVWLMSGQYSEPIKPVRSGKAGSPITYRAANLDKRPVLVAPVGMVFEGVAHVVVDGVAVNGGKRAPDAAVNVFADVYNASNIVIRNGDFRFANGGHGIRVRSSTNVIITKNTLDFVGEYKDATGHATGDAIGVDEASSRVLISENTLRHGGHNLVNMNGSESVIRDNFMDNSWRDVYGGEAGYRSASIKGRWNVFERNHIARNGVGSFYPSNVLAKIQGEFNIARQNVFANAIDQAIESDSGNFSPVSRSARIYNNTFYNLKSAAWRTRFYTSGGQAVGRGAFVNNLVQRSRTNPVNSNQDADVMFLVSDAGAGATAGSRVYGNIFAPAAGASPKVLLDGYEGRIDVSNAEKLYPTLFVRNSAQTATFIVDAPLKRQDFMLAKGSAGIDDGLFLARTTSSGSGLRIPVTDTYFFSDGRGLVEGDMVQLEGGGLRATVLRVDHAGKALEVDRTLYFRTDQGIALAYAGTAPDVGAFEYGLDGGSSAPAPPELVGVD